MEGIQDPALLDRAGRLRFLEELRRSFASWVAESPLRWTVTANVVWELVDRGLEARVVSDRGDLNKALLARTADTRTYEASGPERAYASPEDRYRDLAAYWKQTSILLHRKAEAYGLRYFHFLQPNQYVEDSKPMGPDERAVATPPTSVYKQGATEGYPYLIAAGRQLRAAGVPFTDLTMLFRSVAEPVYSDPCCHINVRGNELIAQEVARVIAEAWEKDR